MNSHDAKLRVELIDLLGDWWWKQSRHPCGPSNPELAKRVQDALLQNRQEREEHSRGGELRHKDSNSMLLALLNETRGVSLATNKPAPPPVMDEPAGVLAIDLDKQELTLRGKAYSCASVQALRWLRVLADNPGVWISGSDLSQRDQELIGVRTDKLKKHLPTEVLNMIESAVGIGSRIVL